MDPEFSDEERFQQLLALQKCEGWTLYVKPLIERETVAIRKKICTGQSENYIGDCTVLETLERIMDSIESEAIRLDALRPVRGMPKEALYDDLSVPR